MFMDRKRNIILSNMVSNEINLGHETPPIHRSGVNRLGSLVVLGLFDVGAPAATYIAAEGFSPIAQNIATGAVGLWSIATSVKAWRSYIA